MKKEIPGTILSLTDFIPNTTRLPLHDLQIYLGCGKKKLIGIIDRKTMNYLSLI